MYAMLSFLKETRFEMCLLRGVPQCFESCSENYIRGLCNIPPSLFAVNENLAEWKWNFCNMQLSSNGKASAVFNLTLLLSTEAILFSDTHPVASAWACVRWSMCSESGRKTCTSAALDEKNAVKQVVAASAGAVLTVTSCSKGQRCK